jgi:hypothetical protein
MIVIIALVFCISCSGNPAAPVTSADDQQIVKVSSGETACLGLWQVAIDKDTESIDITELRTGDKIINVLGFLEPPALSKMTIDFDSLFIDAPIIEVDVVINHPFHPIYNQFTGFDIRGVVFGPELTNADGLTIIPSPEFFSGVPFGYQDGLLGAPDSVGNYEGLAGYKYFTDGLNADVELSEYFSDPFFLTYRGYFPEGGIAVRHYVLDWTDADQDFFVFNYAIYANYDWPVGEGPYDIDDFEITTANSAEAFCCKVTELSNSLYYSDGNGGGTISLEAEIWDWLGNISTVGLASYDANTNIAADTFFSYTGPGNTDKSYLFEIYDVPVNPATAGDLKLLITATDPVTFGEAWLLSLLPGSNVKYDDQVFNGFFHITPVNECPVPAVVSTVPPFGSGILDDVVFNCTGLVNGPSLGVTLTDGVSDWLGTDVTYVSSTEMIADIDLTGAAFGEELDIVITNGCGTDGTGPATWQVLYYIHVVGTPNIDVVGTRTPRDIAIDPSSNQTAVMYDTFWINWSNDYQSSSSSYYSWGSHQMGNMDAQPSLIWYSHAYFTSYGGNYLCWSWADFTGWQSTHSQWQPYNDNRLYDMANAQGSNYLFAAYHFLTSSMTSISIMSTNADYSIGYPAMMTGTFYNGPGNTGVLKDNLIAIDLAEYSGIGKPDMYFLEALPTTNTAVVEKWHVDNTPTFLLAFGENHLYNPLDITVDSNYNIYILEEDSNGDANIWAYNPSGTLIGASGDLTVTELSGDPLRMDCSLSPADDEVHVLHLNGVTRFSMY